MKESLFVAAILLSFGTMASAGCDNFEDGSLPNSVAPQYRICFDDVCDVTRLSYQCANAYEIRQGFANGWATHYTLEPTESFRVTWQGRPIADEKLSRLRIEEIDGPDVIVDDDPSLSLLDTIFVGDYQQDCLPSSEFDLSGIKMDMPVSAVMESGIPVVRGDVIPDFFGFETSSHDGLEIIIDEDIIVEVYSTDPQWVTPSGLRVGLTQAEVIGILGRLPREGMDAWQRYEIGLCYGASNPIADFAALVIAFGSDRRVETIGLQRDWP